MIPITNLDAKLPSRLIIAFTNSTHSAFGLNGLDRVLNVFRVSGLTVNGQISGLI